MSAVSEPSSSTIPPRLSSPVTKDRMSPATNRHLEVFDFFPKLPAELRLKIWRMTFPVDRLVNLNYCPDFPDIDEQIRAMLLEAGLPIVTALYVNKESRNEALRNYCLLFKEDSRRLPQNAHIRPTTPYSRPFCLNTKLDRIYISRYSLHNYWADKWMLYLQEIAPNLLQSILTLEIRDMVWNPKVRASFDQGDKLITLPPAKIEEEMFYPSSLLRFPGLEEISFIFSHPSDANSLLHTAWGTHSGKEELEDCLRKYLETSKNMFIIGRAPKIIVKDWEALPDDKYSWP